MKFIHRLGNSNSFKIHLMIEWYDSNCLTMNTRIKIPHMSLGGG